MIIKPNSDVEPTKRVFLAGSIEMGKAEDWQKQMGTYLSDKGYEVYNPRRDDWDSSWVQSIENEQFRLQVMWEISNILSCDIVIFYFQPGTISPISLYELGLVCNSFNRDVRVICPEGYHRKGNVEVICDMFHIPLHTSLDDFYKKSDF